MKNWISVAAACLLFSAPIVSACTYADDPRLSDERLPALIHDLVAGADVPPIQTQVGTYLLLGEQSRELLEPHLRIVDVQCQSVAVFNGELLSRPTISFEEYYRVMAQAIHDDRPDVAKRLYSHVTVAPMTVAEVQELFGKMPYPGTHGVEVRDRMQAIFPRFATALPADRQLADPLQDGRPQDYAMFKLFQVFGGQLLLDKGCGPYEVDDSFVRTEKVLGRERKVVRRKPFEHLIGAMGHPFSRDSSTSYRIGSCY